MNSPFRLKLTTIAASRRGRRVLVGFLLGVVFVGLGLALTLLPQAEVMVRPTVQLKQTTLSLTVDVDATVPLLEQKIIPGVVPATPSEQQHLLTQGYRELVPGSNMFVHPQQVAGAVVAAVTATLQPEEQVVKGSIHWTSPPAVTAVSLRLFTLKLKVDFALQRRFDVAAWRRHILGLAVPEAEAWLRGQPGVASITILFKPQFLAGLRQKMPKYDSGISFALDVSGKTSILK